MRLFEIRRGIAAPVDEVVRAFVGGRYASEWSQRMNGSEPTASEGRLETEFEIEAMQGGASYRTTFRFEPMSPTATRLTVATTTEPRTAWGWCFQPFRIFLAFEARKVMSQILDDLAHVVEEEQRRLRGGIDT